jgi:WD40 repeat protein
MRNTKNIICLLVLFVLCFILICHPESKGESMKKEGPNRLKRVYFIPQKNLIVGACNSEPNGSIRFWSITDGTLKELLDLGKSEWVVSLAVSNDGNLLVASLLAARDIGCYSLTEKKWLWKVRWVGKGVADTAIRFTTDDRKVVVVGFRDIVIYNVKTGAILQRQEDSKAFSDGFPNYRTRIEAISPSARYVAFWQGNLEHDEGWETSKNIWVVIRDIEKGKTIAKQQNIQEKYKICSGAFTPNERNLFLGSMDGYVKIWSIPEQKVIRKWRAYGHDNASAFDENPSPNMIHEIAFCPDGRHIATMGFLKGRFAVKIWDYATNKLTHEFDDVISSSLPMCSGYPIAFSPDGKYFALEQQGRLCLYDTQTWQEKWCVPSVKGQE